MSKEENNELKKEEKTNSKEEKLLRKNNISKESHPNSKINFNISSPKDQNSIEYLKPIRKNQKIKTTREDASKMLNLVSDGLNKKIKKNIKLNRKYSLDLETKKITFELSSFKKDDKFFKKALKIFQFGAESFKDTQILISFLYNLEPFNQILSESEKDDVKIILNNLTQTLKYEFIQKNKIICKYGQNTEKFYLILKGKVDILVPNEEEIELTEEEYFSYLLNLRIYNENYILKKIISKNCLTFLMEEKNLDEWIKIAYNTLEIIGENYKIINEPNKTNTNQNNIIKKSIFSNKNSSNKFNKKKMPLLLNSTFKIPNIKRPLSPSLKKRIRKSLLIPNENINQEKKKIFDSIERKNLVFRLKEQILIAMKIIEPYNPNLLGVNIGNYISNDVSSEEYVNRIKPYLFNYKFNELKKPAKIISYFIANSLKTGNKFGDMISDINQNNNDFRVSTIITKKNCHFGTLDKIGYCKCLKNVSEKMRKKKLNFLLNANIFRNCNINLFTKSFSNFFSKRLLYSHEELFREGDEPKKNQIIYFIRDGEFSSTCNKSIYEINKIFIDLNYKNLVDPEDEDDCLDKENDKYIKFKKKKNLIKIQYFKENDIVGMNDCICNGKYIYTITCTSPTATVYEIHINFFKLILSSDKKINENVSYEIMVKRNLLIKLLLKNRNDKTNYFKYYSKGGDTLSFGCLTLKKDNSKNPFFKLLEIREKEKKGEFFLKSIHKKKFNLIIDNIQTFYDKEPEIFTIKKFNFLNDDDNENNIKKSRNNYLFKELIKGKNHSIRLNYNLTEGNKRTISVNEDELPKIFNKKLNNRSKNDNINNYNNTTYFSNSYVKSNLMTNNSERKSNLIENNISERKSNLVDNSEELDKKLINTKMFRKDNTILPIHNNLSEKIKKTKIFINHIPNFLSNKKISYKDKKKTIFNTTNKTMYKTIFNGK